jgi:hypothetical protein
MKTQAAVVGHSAALITRLDLRMEARVAAAVHSSSLVSHLDLGMQGWATAAGHSGAVLHRLDLRLEMASGQRGKKWLVDMFRCIELH